MNDQHGDSLDFLTRSRIQQPTFLQRRDHPATQESLDNSLTHRHALVTQVAKLLAGLYEPLESLDAECCSEVDEVQESRKVVPGDGGGRRGRESGEVGRGGREGRGGVGTEGSESLESCSGDLDHENVVVTCISPSVPTSREKEMD
jgi:hypothetical protein